MSGPSFAKTKLTKLTGRVKSSVFNRDSYLSAEDLGVTWLDVPILPQIVMQEKTQEGLLTGNADGNGALKYERPDTRDERRVQPPSFLLYPNRSPSRPPASECESSSKLLWSFLSWRHYEGAQVFWMLERQL